MNNLFQYVPGNSLIHRMNPVTKIFMTIIICAAIIAVFWKLAQHKGIPTVLIILGILLLVYNFITQKTVMAKDPETFDRMINAIYDTAARSQREPEIHYFDGMGLCATVRYYEMIEILRPQHSFARRRRVAVARGVICARTRLAVVRHLAWNAADGEAIPFGIDPATAQRIGTPKLKHVKTVFQPIALPAVHDESRRRRHCNRIGLRVGRHRTFKCQVRMFRRRQEHEAPEQKRQSGTDGAHPNTPITGLPSRA